MSAMQESRRYWEEKLILNFDRHVVAWPQPDLDRGFNQAKRGEAGYACGMDIWKQVNQDKQSASFLSVSKFYPVELGKIRDPDSEKTTTDLTPTYFWHILKLD